MQLVVDSDAAYLVLPKARSRFAGYFRLLDHPSTRHKTLYNGPILIECKTIRHVVSSAAEAERHGVFQNSKTAVSLQNILHKLGHDQPLTPIITDNSTTTGFVDKTIQMKRSKLWDMHLHWLRARKTRQHFEGMRKRGLDNKVD